MKVKMKMVMIKKVAKALLLTNMQELDDALKRPLETVCRLLSLVRLL